jgi:hypothetical protein
MSNRLKFIIICSLLLILMLFSYSGISVHDVQGQSLRTNNKTMPTSTVYNGLLLNHIINDKGNGTEKINIALGPFVNKSYSANRFTLNIKDVPTNGIASVPPGANAIKDLIVTYKPNMGWLL